MELDAATVIEALSTCGGSVVLVSESGFAGIHPLPGESVEIQVTMKIYGRNCDA